MKKKTYIHILPALLGLCILLTSCGQDEKTGQAAAAQQIPQLPVITVPTKTVTAYSTYPTSIEGIVNSEVRAKIAGYITEVLVDEGQKVKKGQTLFKLETQSLNQDADAAKASVNVAQVEVDKLKPLVEKDIISNVQLETAKAQLQQARSSYNSINANINYANIKSPVDGYVGSIRLRKGNLISPSDQMPLTTVSDISEVYAYFSMNEKDYFDFIKEANGSDISEKIKNMPEIELILANGSEYEQKGKIQTINSQVNTNTGSIQFRAIFDNPTQMLTNGNSGKVKIPKTYENAIVVPSASTFERQGSTFVYKFGKDSMAVAAQFAIKAQVENLFVVASGIDEGEQIVAKGLAKLRGETKIKPQEVPFDSIAKPIEQVFK
ncbi:efflux RND transporter periplasmic adaptor subunit [Flavimarina sp. Hel_I_48]|uniref:efflux RND transporter periplasmic adaptor subunit n=1 Tax=Flavimarina sp. Hel_I_48 TaxID=1392488 RepID=UPI0004DF84E2